VNWRLARPNASRAMHNKSSSLCELILASDLALAVKSGFDVCPFRLSNAFWPVVAHRNFPAHRRVTPVYPEGLRSAVLLCRGRPSPSPLPLPDGNQRRGGSSHRGQKRPAYHHPAPVIAHSATWADLESVRACAARSPAGAAACGRRSVRRPSTLRSIKHAGSYASDAGRQGTRGARPRASEAQASGVQPSFGPSC